MIKKIIFGTSFLFCALSSLLFINENGYVHASAEQIKSQPEKQENNLIIKTNVKDLKSRRGIRFFYMQDKSAPLVHVRIVFKNSGSAYQEKSKAGLPVFFSETVFQGCGKYSPAEFEKELSDIVSPIKCECNADCVEFSLTAPTIVLEKAAALLNLALREPKFEEEKVKTIQEAIIASLQNYAVNPLNVAKNKFIPALIFKSKSHVYENGLYGSAEDFAKLLIDDLKAYKEKFIVAKNAEACVFGNISEGNANRLIDKIFEKIADGKGAADNIDDVEPNLTATVDRYFVPGPQSTIVFALKTVPINAPAKERYAADIASLILGNPPLFKTKIMGILRSKLGYIYGGRIIPVHWKHASYLLGILQTDNAKVDKAISALKDIICDLRQNGITKSELEFAKGFRIGGTMLVQLRTAKNLCAFYFSEMQKGSGTNALSEKFEGINAVTLDDVKDFCAKNLDENNIPFIVIGGKAK